MCGGIIYNLDRIPKEKLKKFYSVDQIKLFEKRGLVSSFYWDKRPILPALIDGKISLFDWGNRDKNNNLPQTGWAKEESINNKRWDWLNPKKITIPVDYGYEKGKWFKFACNIDGLLIEKNGDKRVYMITQKSDDQYFTKTRHDRMPKVKIKQYIDKMI